VLASALLIGHYALVEGREHSVTVVSESGLEEVWYLRWQTDNARHAYRMELRSDDGRMWVADAGDVFGCLCVIRRETDQSGIKLA
jgi:hypothetical protein